jgi:hypothetical protein
MEVFRNGIAQEAQKTKLPQNISDAMKKWANELDRAFSKEEIQMAKKKKKNMKKMLTIPGHKENANQNHTKTPLSSLLLE